MRKRVRVASGASAVVCLSVLVLSMTLPPPPGAQPAPEGGLVFAKSEYAARRAALMAKVPDGAVVILGAKPITGYNPYVQNNDFMYFSGVEAPDAYLVIDGLRKESVLFLSLSERGARSEGFPLGLALDPVGLTGIERVQPAEQFSSYLARLAGQNYVLYTSFKPEELNREVSTEKLNVLQQSMTLDSWDGRLTRELQFVDVLRRRFPGLGVKDAAPAIWELRQIKSPAEIDVVRQAGRIGARAMTEMMRATRAGGGEWEIAAVFEFACRAAGARDIAYNTIISSAGNHPFLHYYRHDRMLADGDFLVVDAGPDVGYYDVDISISYPANGRFTPRQREIYEAALAVQQASVARYRPGVTCEQVVAEVSEELRTMGYDPDGPLFKPRTMRNGCSHYVGMAVHDVGGSPRGPLRPGMVFACDIYAVYADEDLGVRVEDTVVITETGCENLTAGIPRTVDEIERLMREPGVIQVLKDRALYPTSGGKL